MDFADGGLLLQTDAQERQFILTVSQFDATVISVML